MKIMLCTQKGCCPFVEIRDNEVLIGEGNNVCRLTKEQFEILKEKIKSGEI